MNYDEIKGTLLSAAKRLEKAYAAEPHGDSDWEVEYATGLLALAAREFANATEALPRDECPVGWSTGPHRERASQ